MKRWVKRIRGVVGMGLTWATAWFGVGAILGLVFWGETLNAAWFENTLQIAVLGFIGGTAFSGVLGIAEGRRTFEEMSMRRFAGWGAVGGLVVALLMVGGAVSAPGAASILGFLTLLGAGSAAGSLALARRAGSLLESGEEVGLLEGKTPDPST